MEFPPLKNDLILRAASGEQIERAPVWVMRQAGRYLPEFREVRKTHDFFQMCQTPEVAAEITIQPIRHYQGLLDAAIIFSDILVIPQAMGMDLKMLPGIGPKFTAPIASPEDFDKLEQNMDVRVNLKYVYDAITLTRQQLDGQVPLFGFCGAPMTLLGYMIEGGGTKSFSTFKKMLLNHPAASLKMLQKITDYCVDHLIAQAEAGAQMLQVFESWGGDLSPDMFDTFAMPFLTQIADRLKHHFVSSGASIPLFVFPRNAHHAITPLSHSNYDVIGLDWCIRPAEAMRLNTGGKVLQGNMDPSVLYADIPVIEKTVDQIAATFFAEKKSHWIANMGHGMLPDHNPEHLKAFLQATHTYSSRAASPSN